MAVIALVVGKAEPTIGIDRIKAPILQRIGPDLVGKANPPPLLAQVKEDPSPRFANDPESFVKLRSAVAFE